MKTKEEILYDVAGLIYTEHPKVIEAMTDFAKEYHTEQLRLCGVGSSYVVFEDGKNQGVDGLVQLSISLPTIEGARNYAKSWKNKELRIYKLIE